MRAGITFVARRFYQAGVHPRKFLQVLTLTDGSNIMVTSLSPKRLSLKLNVDSVSHPSWNPQIHGRILLDDHGQVAKFKQRFGGMENFDSFELSMPAAEPAKAKAILPKKTTKKK